jgi:murein DD-endopeptidase MepM/ murein hydrolase activator NlpD
MRETSMTLLSYPLERNEIRGASPSNAFGMVRNGKTRPHQGWDLIAVPGTPCFAIADGRIELKAVEKNLGRYLVLRFEHRGQVLFATYAHLSVDYVKIGLRVPRGTMLGRTGISGNAKSMRGSDQYLHFEIRTIAKAGLGLTGRIDPAQIYGAAPISGVVFEGHGMKLERRTAHGMKLNGINVRD